MGFIHAPESSLVGEHRQVVSQVDIMPTLLGLMGYDKPYFAFGRDIFNELSEEPMSVSYDNNLFQAITGQHLILFDESRIVGVYTKDDIKRERNLMDEIDTSSIERRMKAMIQGYYTRIERKSYVVESVAKEEC